MQVTFLGTGDAFNARARNHACYLVTAPSGRLLLDCGPGVLSALKKIGLSADDIDAVLLSHLHGDHIAGVPFLFLAGVYDTPRHRPLTLIGPPGTEQRMNDLYRGMYRELAARPLPFEVRCIEADGGSRVIEGPIDVLPFRVPHQEKEISLGLRLRIDGKTILYSGDTGWTEDLVRQSRDTDLFICECCFYETRVSFHLDYPRIAENHPRFGCRRLVLTHIGREVFEHLDEISLELSHDGMVIDL